MEFSLRSWKPGHLLLGWATYWVGLAAVTLAPAINATWRATHLPDGHGSISAGFSNTTLNYSVIEDGAKTLEMSAPLSALLFWIAVPPLVLWLVWLVMRARRGEQRTVGGHSDAPGLTAGSPPADEWRARREESLGVEQGRVRTPNP
jgi:hypothetical protein